MQAFYRAADAAGPVNRGHLDMHTAIRGSLYRQFALLPAHAGDFSPDFYQLLQASGMDAVVRHTEAGGTFTHFTCEKFAAQSATLELGKVMPFGANDLSLFAAADAAIRAWIADAPLPPRDKAPVDYFLVEESIIKREGEFTLNLAADVENFTALPAGYAGPGPLYPLSQRRGRHRPARRAVAPRRCPSSPATSLRKHHD